MIESLPIGMHERIPEGRYHTDALMVNPTLSHGLARIMLAYSPLHARHEHPRLNLDWKPEELDSTEQSRKDFGTAVHCMLLEPERVDERIVVVHADSWRKKEHSEQREAAIANGQVAILVERFERAVAMVVAAEAQLAHADWKPGPLHKRELTMLWDEIEGYPVYCRARPDIADLERDILVNYKTFSGSANPASLARQAEAMGWDVDAAFYMRGYERLTGRAPRYLYVVQENFAPFALSVVELDELTLNAGREKVEAALALWRQGIEFADWPGYPQRICKLEPMSHALDRWEAQKNNEYAELIDWQKYGGGIQG